MVVSRFQNQTCWWNQSRAAAFTEADCKVAVAPDAEIKQEVLVELRQQDAVAIAGDLLQEQLARHQYTHIQHSARHLP